MPNNTESRVITIICSLTAIGVAWIGASIIDLKITVAGLSEKVSTLQTEMTRISTEQAKITSRVKHK